MRAAARPPLLRTAPVARLARSSSPPKVPRARVGPLFCAHAQPHHPTQNGPFHLGLWLNALNQHKIAPFISGSVPVAGELPVEMSGCGRGLATMVTAEGGAALLAAISSAGAGAELNGSYSSIRRPGAFASIDAAGHMQVCAALWVPNTTLRCEF